MRVTPSAKVALALFVLYVALVALMWKLMGFDYDHIADSVDTIRKGVVIPIAGGAAFLALAATALGWWGPSLREPRRSPDALGIVVILVLAVGTATNLVATDWDHVAGSFVAWLVVGVLLVGFAEELLCRGLMLVGARGTFTETRAKWFTAVMFGLLHVVNLGFGQSGSATVQQVVFATLLGLVYYGVRRTTGGLVVPILLHAAWDGALFVNDHSGASPSPLAGVLMLVAIALAFVAARRASRSGAAAA